MKCQSRKSISIISVLVLIISLIGLSACCQSPHETSYTSSPEETQHYTPTESTVPPLDIIGEWRGNDSNNYISLFFYTDMSFELMFTVIDDSSLGYSNCGEYSIHDNLVTLTYDSDYEPYDCIYDSEQCTITAYDTVLTYIPAKNDAPLSVSGTWKTLSESSFFPFHFAQMDYGHADSITFYNDGSYAITFDSHGNTQYHGTYEIIHDGTAIKIDDSGFHSAETMRYSLISDNLLVIESNPSSRPGVYYVLTSAN